MKVMANDFFHFKQFSIYQDRCAMKVGTDGVLLGAWVGTENAVRILDIGTGTGLIALMLAQRSKASIDGIEINKKAALQAKDNINRSAWKNRIMIHAVPLQKYILVNTKYDLIVSNPPYFSDYPKSKGTSRELARQNSVLSVEELLNGVCSLMKKTGRFALIYPAETFSELLSQASIRELSPHKIMNVIPTPGNKVKRILAEFSYGKHEAESDKLIVEDKGRHQYSEKYKLLTRDYYLDF
jgi:tRNA1Val (adenine37-N6)-methyltransferase